MAQITGVDWEVTDSAVGTTLARTMGYDAVSNQVVISDQGGSAVFVFNGDTGAAGSPTTLSTAGLSFTDRNLPFFGIGVSDSGVIYSFLNDTDGAAPPGDGVVRWADINAAPVEIATLNTADSAAFFPRNLEILSANGTDVIVEVGDTDGGDIQFWTWDGATFALSTDSITADGIGGPNFGGKSGADIDAWPPNYALGADVVGAASNGAHLWENTAGGSPATWSFVGNLPVPATVSATDVAACIDVGFDTAVGCAEAPVMFAMFAPGVTADTVTVVMYSYPAGVILDEFAIATGGANPSSGGAFQIDEANDQLYYGWRTTTGATNFTYGRVSYSHPVGAPSFIDAASATIDVAVTNAEIDAANGSGVISLRGMGSNPNTGNLIFYDGDSQATAAGIMEADVSGVSPVLSILVPAADLVAVSNGATINANAVRVDTSNSIYVSSFQGPDEILRVVDPGGGGQAVTEIYEQDGIVGIDVSLDQSVLYLTQEAAFGAVNQDILAIPVGGGAPSIVVTEVAVNAAVSGTDPSFVTPRTDPCSGDVITFDSGAFGGTDNVIRVDPVGSTVAIEVPTSAFPLFNEAGEQIAVDSLGTIYVFESAGGDPAEGQLHIVNPSGGVVQIPYTAIAAVTGSSSGIFEAEDVVVAETASTVTLYVGDDEAPQSIVSITFDIVTTTPAAEFHLYR